MTKMGVFSDPSAAGRYDQARELSADTIELWLEALRTHIDFTRVRTILDLGCGTCRFAIPMANSANARVIAVDPSAAMLAVGASRKVANIEWRLGSADSIPVPNNSVDLIFMSQVYHH
jgi:ubiquinone/menaquinone biosynthesis C-methylase UbiE